MSKRSTTETADSSHTIIISTSNSLVATTTTTTTTTTSTTATIAYIRFLLLSPTKHAGSQRRGRTAATATSHYIHKVTKNTRISQENDQNRAKGRRISLFCHFCTRPLFASLKIGL